MKMKFVFFYLLMYSSLLGQEKFPFEIIQKDIIEPEFTHAIFSPDNEYIGNAVPRTEKISLWIDKPEAKFEWYSSTINTINGESYIIPILRHTTVVEKANRIFCWGPMSNEDLFQNNPFLFIFDLSGNQVNDIYTNVSTRSNAQVSSSGEFIIFGSLTDPKKGRISVLKKYNAQGGLSWETEIKNEFCAGFTSLSIDDQDNIYINTSSQFSPCGPEKNSSYSITLVYDKEGKLLEEISHHLLVSVFYPISTTSGFLVTGGGINIFWYQKNTLRTSYSLVSDIGRSPTPPILCYDKKRETLFIHKLGTPIEVFVFKNKDKTEYDYFKIEYETIRFEDWLYMNSPKPGYLKVVQPWSSTLIKY